MAYNKPDVFRLSDYFTIQRGDITKLGRSIPCRTPLDVLYLVYTFDILHFRARGKFVVAVRRHMYNLNGKNESCCVKKSDHQKVTSVAYGLAKSKSSGNQHLQDQ